MKHIPLIPLLACIGLSACQQNTSPPAQVAERYWQSLKSGDVAAAKLLVSKDSQSSLDSYLALPDDKRISLDNVNLGEEKTSVHTTITSQSNDAKQTPNADQFDFETILVLQDGEWKVDALRTEIPAPQKVDPPSNNDQLSDALQENLDSMDDALEQGADMLNEFLQEGSKEMSESLLKGMNKMNESLREAIENMKQQREQQDSPQPPADENGEGLI